MQFIDNLKAAIERGEHEAEIADFFEKLKRHAIQYPEPVFAVLREWKPVLVVKGNAIVTRFADVQEVLSRDDVFQVTYGEKMRVITGGRDFFLGMPNSPEYERDVAHMRSVMRRQDVEGKIVPFVSQAAEELVTSSGGHIDVAVELGRMVPAKWVASYFGCTPPSNAELAAWGSAIFRYLFTDLTNDPAVGAAARDAAAKTRAWLDESIAERKAHPTEADDVLNRCLKLQASGLPGMDDLGIRDNLIGLLTGAIPTTAKCCAQALDELLKRPDQLEKAQAAARADDDALFAQYVFEALRFNPNNPGLFRIAAEDYTVAKGQPHATLIPKGSTVFAATQSAMFDGRVVDDPCEFRIGRPPYVAMHWGYGLHTCFGQYINAVQIPGILKAVLKRQGLSRAAGDAGRLQYDGPFPSKLEIQFEAASQRAGSGSPTTGSSSLPSQR